MSEPVKPLTKKERERLQRELRFLGYRTLAGRVTYDELERMQEIKSLLAEKESSVQS